MLVRIGRTLHKNVGITLSKGPILPNTDTDENDFFSVLILSVRLWSMTFIPQVTPLSIKWKRLEKLHERKGRVLEISRLSL